MKTALLIIDVQKGMFLKENPVHGAEELLGNIKELIAQARSNDASVVYIQHNAPSGRLLERGSDAWQITSEIAPLPHDIMIEKTTPDSFHETALYEELKRLDVEHLVLAGIQSEVCVDTTCRRAFSLRFNVTLAADAHSTWGTGELSAQQIVTHHNEVLRWFADVKKTRDIDFG
ncbi:cysteine hydrolase family protein [Fictibacillus iocasae]|uniref:Cysteine hydrolase family protein n=1 Tax=Fictibacillus iocasae TaxID=2715437 RepID=A0ABW2NNU7_9BACL